MSGGAKLGFEFPVSIEASNAGLFVSPGYGTHATRVLDSYELIFVTRGELDLFEEEERFHVEPNQTLLLFPGRRHGGLLPYAQELNFYWVHFRLQKEIPSAARIRVPKLATVSDPVALTETFCQFISDQESGALAPVNAAHLIALMLCAVAEADDSRTQAPAGKRRRTSVAERVQRFLDENFQTPITTSTIARALRYNPDYLERVYRDQEETSIIEGLHLRRIAAARALLRNEVGKNINEIAFACGYSDPGYFRRKFKRLTGLTPKQFRTLYGRTHINAH